MVTHSDDERGYGFVVGLAAVVSIYLRAYSLASIDGDATSPATPGTC